MLASPAVESADPSLRDESGEIAVAFLVHNQKCSGMSSRLSAIARRDGVVVGDQELGSDNRLDSLATGGKHEPDDAPKIGCVGETECGISQGSGAPHEGFGGDGAVAKGEGGVGAEFGVHELSAISYQLSELKGVGSACERRAPSSL